MKIIRDQYDLMKAQEAGENLLRYVEQAEQELSAAKQELDLKESMNDYLRYLQDKAQMDENQAMIDASMDSNTDQLAKLHQYAYTKKQLDDRKLADIRKQLEQRKKEFTALQEEVTCLTHVAEEGNVALAVARSHKEHFEQEYHKYMEEIAAVRKDISILVLSDLADLERTLQEEEQELDEKKAVLDASYLEDLAEINTLEKQQYVEQEALEHAQAQLVTAEENHKEYVENQERLKKMTQVYGVKDMGDLYETIKERAFQQKVAVAELGKKIAAGNRHLEQVQEGRILEETEAVAKVKDYLESRHGDFALSGVDYLSALPKANREELLQCFPMLPYGVVTKQFKDVEEDERIDTLELGNQAVMIYDQKILETPHLPTKMDGVKLLAKNPQTFVEEDALSMEATRLQKQLAELKEEMERAKELDTTYEEDLDYTAKLTDAAFLNAERDVQKLREQILEHERTLETLKKNKERVQTHCEQQKTEVAVCEETLHTNQKEQLKLAGIRAKSDLAEETKTQLDFYESEVKRLSNDTTDADSKLENAKLKVSELDGQIHHMETQIAEVTSDWETLYKDYYVENNLTVVNISFLIGHLDKCPLAR